MAHSTSPQSSQSLPLRTPSSSVSSSRAGSMSKVQRSPVIGPQSISTSALPPASTSTSNTPVQTPRKDSASKTSPSVSKRTSFAENLNLNLNTNLRHPASPRAHRTLSFSGSALTELLMSPTHRPNGADERFRGKDWRKIEVQDIVEPNEVRFVELDTSIEDTTKLLIRSGSPNVVLVRESTRTHTVIQTFDYSDLNAYLLLVLGLSQPDELAAKIADRARSGDVIPLRDVTDHLGVREEPAFLPHTATLSQAMEVLGGGHHRVVICKEGTSEAVGVLSQLRLVRFFWDNHASFAATEKLYSLTLKELELGAKEVLAINGDKPVADALRLMHAEGITSLPVLDAQGHVVGNISHVDVRLLTDTSAIPLLGSSCLHFISVILSERGMLDGKDSYPVFHVTHFSTLAHTVAKLCATRSHRMWIVDAPSPGSSVPPSPGIHHVSPPFSPPNSATFQHFTPVTTPNRHGNSENGLASIRHAPSESSNASVAVPAGTLPGTGMSGRLSGVVSLTDILNLFARASGLSPGDPEETRRRRRQSSSSSVRPSMDSMRPSVEALKQSVELSRSDKGRSSSKSSSRDRGNSNAAGGR